MQTYLVKIKNNMIVDGSDISFQYMNKACGISSTAKDGVFSFVSWFGDLTKTYSNIDDALSDNFFGGSSLSNLAKNRIVRINFN